MFSFKNHNNLIININFKIKHFFIEQKLFRIIEIKLFQMNSTWVSMLLLNLPIGAF